MIYRLFILLAPRTLFDLRPRRRLGARGALLAALLLGLGAVGEGGGARADEIHLTNGNTFSGDIVSMTDDVVIVEAAGAEMSIPRKEIVKIVETKAPSDAAGAKGGAMERADVEAHVEALAANLRAAENAAADQPEAGRQARLAAIWKTEDALLPWARDLAARNSLTEEDAAMKELADAAGDDTARRDAANLPRALLRLAAAEAAREALDSELSARHLEAALRLAPDALSPRLESARIDWRRGRAKEVVAQLEQPFRDAPREFLRRGDNAFLMLRAYRDAAQPRDAVVLLALLDRLKIDSPALDDYVEKNRADFAGTYLAAAQVAMQSGERDDARNLLERAIELKRSERDPRFEQAISLIYYAMGDQENGLIWQEKARGSNANARGAANPVAGYSVQLQAASESDLGRALERAKEEKKDVLLYVGATWCGPCHFFREKVLTTAQAQRFIAKNFILVVKESDVGDGVQIASKFKVSSYPSFLVLRSNASVALRFSGAPPTPDDLERSLRPAL